MFNASYPLPTSSNTRSSPQVNPLPLPPPPGNISPLRRDHVPQPPPLTTSLNLAVSSGYNPTPHSAVTLSSPFSLNNPAYQASTPGGAARGISPMSSRFASGYTAPYNPQEWAPSNASSPHGQQGHPPAHIRNVQRPQTGDQDGMASPPPPYSPTSNDTAARTSSGTNLSPAEGNVYSSHNSTPTSTYMSMSPNLSSAAPFARSRQASGMRSAESQSNFPPPPPPPPGKSNPRPSSRLSNLIAGGQSRRSTFSPSQGVSPLNTQNVTSAAYTVETSIAPPNVFPPNARRAASTGVISASSSSSRNTSHANSRSPSGERNWENSRPLPGPPPGPPPSSSRSQSVSGASDTMSRQLLTTALRPKVRQAPALGSTLGPVPPTPAGWVDDGTLPDLRVVSNLHVNTAGLSGRSVQYTESLSDTPAGISAVQSQPNSGNGLIRSSAVRDSSAKGLRERRGVNRSARTSIADLSALSINSNNPWLGSVKSSPLSFSDPNHAQIDTAQTTPESLIDPTDKPNVLSSPETPNRATSAESQHSTPKATQPNVFKVATPLETQTPPWSAGAGPSSPTIQSNPAIWVPAKGLPTPPLGHARRLETSITRPISHILHSPNEATSIPSLSPAVQRNPVQFTTRDSTELDMRDDEIFMAESTQRHEAFLRNERGAANDGDRLRLFAEYILAESRIRRERYAEAWTNGAIDASSVREGLFEPSEQVPPIQRRASGVLRLVTTDGNPENNWGGSYQPMLSPIASMSNDDLSSRGRAPSRWWESQPDSNSEGRRRKLERSKRESKYMGVPREAREAMQLGADEITPRTIPGDLRQTTFDLQPEYPDEKANPENLGFYDDRPSPAFSSRSKLPKSPKMLDISRFITLPPPYPRHHPAVNNSHPNLVQYRTAVRNMSDLTDIASRKSRYKLGVDALRQGHQRRLSDSRRTFKAEIRTQIEEGSLSYAEAAEAEQAMKLEEQEAEKKSIKAKFDSFQDVVLNPLHDMLNGRVTQLDALITDLQHKLITDAQSLNPDQPQEAGDEEPELLEKLTQLKWLFETREQIQRELFGLLTERNETYKEVILLPYRQANNADKIRSTEAFFTQDNKDRLAIFERDALARYESFIEVVEDNVTRGVELQSSAFWDIAPGLEDLLQKIPARLEDFEGIQIPEQELEENRTYHSYPFQYLYSLLVHAERSTYQFIEAQTNLHCLLHEVKNGVLVSRYRALDAQRMKEGTETPGLLHDASNAKAREEAMLTTDLQQKVSMVENIWAEALGSQIQGTKERVKVHLEIEGGWEDMLRAEE